MCIQASQKNLYLILPWENGFLCALQSGIHITGSGYLPFGATQHLKHPPTFEEFSYQMRHSPPCTIKAENDRQTLAQPSCTEVLAPNRVPLIRYSHQDFDLEATASKHQWPESLVGGVPTAGLQRQPFHQQPPGAVALLATVGTVSPNPAQWYDGERHHYRCPEPYKDTASHLIFSNKFPFY